jgi:hypothetical protein
MMTDTFNPECPNCKVTIGRIEKWIDHVNCPPKKWQRYDRLIEFVTMIASETLPYGTDHQNNATLHWINQAATNLLKEFKEYELLRSNGLAKSRKESNPK